MKRFLVPALLCAGLSVTGGPASAHWSDVPDYVMGATSYKEPGGVKLTVGYIPCGFTVPGIADFYAKVVRPQTATVSVMAHSPGLLDAHLQALTGVALPAEAIDALVEASGIYTC